MMLLNACSRSVVPIVQTKNDFCITHESVWLEPKDKQNITLMRQNDDFKVTIDKILKNTLINEEEKELCLQKNN